MSEPVIDRLIAASRQELARTLEDICREIGAAEASVLCPGRVGELAFFASTNPALMQPGAPSVPVNASFSGIAYRTGQTIAVADAAGQAQHYEAIDAVTKQRTHEFAAIPIMERGVLGVLTLFNRANRAGKAEPFTLAELRRAEGTAREIARAFLRLPGLRGVESGEESLAQSLDAEFVAQLLRLSDAERRIAHSLVDALIENRAS